MKSKSPKHGSRLVSFVLITVLVLISVSSSMAAPPPPQDMIAGTVELPASARFFHGDFASALDSRNPKMDSVLANLASAAKVSVSSGVDVANAQNLRLSGDRVQVQVVTTPDGKKNAVAAIAGAGGQVTGTGDGDTLIQAWVPMDALETVAAQDDVLYIRRPAELVLLEDLTAGNSTTEGLAVINGPAWHAAGFTGAGVKIGIIDGGFTDYPDRVATGDLPATVTAKNFVDGETDGQVDGSSPHGTACAEIIHDIAPDATLYLVKVATNVDLAEAEAWLKTQGVHIFSSSIGYYNVTPGDGTGQFAVLAQDARNNGILWVTAASNDREAHWGGLYADSNFNDFHEFNGKEINCFGPGDSTCYNINPGFSFTVFLRWNDWTTVDQNYDMLLVRWNGSGWDPIGGSNNPQTGLPGQRPTEAAVGITSGSAAPYGFVVGRISSNQTVNFELFVPKFLPPDEILHARSLGNLADVPDAMTVAALDVTSPFPQEDYSSEGPTNGPGGAELGGANKPDISGFANVATESYEGSTFNGTSSATPHVAGAAALVLSAYPAYGPDEIQAFLEDRAIDMGIGDPNTQFGHGRLHLGDPPAAPDLSIVKEVVDSEPAPGDPVTFTLSVENSGMAGAAGVVVTDTLSTAILTPTWEASPSLAGTSLQGGTTYVWNLPSLIVDASGVITVYGTLDPSLPAGFAFVNTAVIGTADEDSDLNNNSSSVMVGGRRVYLPLIMRSA